MSIETLYEREEKHLEEMYSSGQITLAQYNKEVREMQRDYQAQAQESAERAYDDEMARW